MYLVLISSIIKCFFISDYEIVQVAPTCDVKGNSYVPSGFEDKRGESSSLTIEKMAL